MQLSGIMEHSIPNACGGVVRHFTVYHKNLPEGARNCCPYVPLHIIERFMSTTAFNCDKQTGIDRRDALKALF